MEGDRIYVDIEVVVPPEVDDTQVDAAITRAIQRVADLAFEVSQEWCPVRTGQLKASGHLEVYPDGFKLWYEQPYAGIQDKGRPRTPITGEQTVYVEGYDRVTEKGYTVSVPSHVRVYVNCRVVPIQTEQGLIFRVMYEWPEIIGTGFITDAVDEAWAQFDAILDEEIGAILPPEYELFDEGE